MANLINQLEVTLTRWEECSAVRGIEINAGEPDACGHRRTVSAYQHTYGGGYIIQTNFCDFYESRGSFGDAMAVAMKLASYVDANGAPADADAE
jgi:hypothetical protein